VKQHAQTARLLGVDFVPRYQAFEAADAAAASTPITPTPAMPAPVTSAHGTNAPATPAPKASTTEGVVQAPPEVEIKPRTSMATKAAGASKAVGTGFVPSTAPAPAIKPMDRGEAQARLDALRARYEADAPHRQFVTAFNNIVFGDGDPCARLVFVGEAPGEEEDKTGKPFVGRAGQLLNKMIAAMGTSREEVYICNVLKTRPPNNATPTSFESNLCKPYLMEQLAILQPEAIVTLGLPATHTLLECTDSMARLRGKWASLKLANGLVVPVMATYHPAYLLRSYTPENRAKVWSDLLMVVEKLGLTPSRKAQEEGGAG
jgi:DNA polymerase